MYSSTCVNICSIRVVELQKVKHFFFLLQCNLSFLVINIFKKLKGKKYSFALVSQFPYVTAPNELYAENSANNS